MGWAWLWGTTKWGRRASCCTSFRRFGEELTRVFDPNRPEIDATHSLLNLSQGSWPVVDYIIHFCITVADSAWNEAALFDTFYWELSDCLIVFPGSPLSDPLWSYGFSHPAWLQILRAPVWEVPRFSLFSSSHQVSTYPSPTEWDLTPGFWSFRVPWANASGTFPCDIKIAWTKILP